MVPFICAILVRYSLICKSSGSTNVEADLSVENFNKNVSSRSRSADTDTDELSASTVDVFEESVV